MAQTQIPFDINSVDVLHLELTTKCNASCLQCDRTDPNSGYSVDHDLSLSRIQELFTEDQVRRLGKMFACGTFGDPAAARECLNIFRWFREINPNITLGMNTNGGLRGPDFWTELGRMLSGPLDYCVFSIDGLAGTNDIYRQNVQWHRLIMNAQAFISAGGRAHWDMLVFEHNQHQVDTCRNMAKQLGFVRFRTKVSNRFQERPVLFLDPPVGWQQPQQSTGPIQCHALEERSLYLAATGQILPCCFFGSEVFRMDQDLKQALAEPGFPRIVEKWQDQPYKTCARNCSSSGSGSFFLDQWTEETAFD